MWCDVIYDMTWHDMTWHDMTWHDTIRYDTIRYDMIWYIKNVLLLWYPRNKCRCWELIRWQAWCLWYNGWIYGWLFTLCAKYRLDNPRNCVIGHLNVNSIRNKFDAVECVLNEGLLDIFAISESKLDDSFPLSQFSVTDFSIHRRGRNRYGGGIMFYVRSNIPHRRRADLEPEPKHYHGT